MWIMITAKLPTKPSPPKMSLFWSTPLGEHKYARQQIREFIRDGAWEDFGLDEFEYDENGKKLSEELLWEKSKALLTTQTIGYAAVVLGGEQNWVGARQILYKDQQITVFPHEFSIMKHENMALYLGLVEGEPGSHELVTSSVADKEIALDLLEGQRKETYDAALVDGATKEQAYAMALGIDVSEENFTAAFPPIGWYRCRPEYAELFCNDWEMVES